MAASEQFLGVGKKYSMIKSGDNVPSVPVKIVDGSEISDASSSDVLGKGLVVFFAVPGAFTPTCHVNHLPGFLAAASKFAAEGVDKIVCLATNDQFVMKAWGEASNALGKIVFLADGNGALAKAMGVDRDFSAGGMGVRYARCAGIVRDGVVEAVFVEDAPGVNASGAPAVLVALQGAKATS